jgi:hypothetical protein
MIELNLKKVSLFIVMIFSLFIIAGCSASNTAERRLEREGYVVESGEEKEVSNELSQYGIEDIANIYLVYDGEDDDIPNAIIVEYDNQDALADDILGEGETLEDYEDNVYRNLFVISLEVMNIDNIIDIIKGN